MDIEKGAVQGPVTEMILDGHKIRTLLIEVRGEGMTESMCRDRKVPLQTIKMFLDVATSGILDDVGIRLSTGKEPSSWFSMSFPVIGKNLQSAGGEHGVSFGPVLGATDENPKILALDIFVPQRADLADPETRGIEQDNEGLMLEIGNGIDECENFLLGQNEGQLGAILHPRHFDLTPSLLEDVYPEEADGGSVGIDAVVGEFAVVLEMEKISADIIVGGVFGRNRKGFGKPGEIGFQGRVIVLHCVDGKVSKVKIGIHFLEVGIINRSRHKRSPFRTGCRC